MERSEEKNARIQTAPLERSASTELGAELSLPDYRSEISRLLLVRPLASPPTVFVNGGRAELSGNVCYHILYLGPDGAPYSAKSEESYAFSIPLEGQTNTESIEVTAQVTPEAITSRVIAPRKLSVRCRLRGTVQSHGIRSVAPQVQGGGELYRLCHGVENGRLLTAQPLQFELSHRLALDGGYDELRVVAGNGQPVFTRVCATEGGVLCIGELPITLLAMHESGEQELPLTLECRIPFEQEVALEGARPELGARAIGTVKEINATVEEDHVLIEAVVVLTVEQQYEESVLLCDDLFSPAHRAECTHREERLWRIGPCTNRNFSVSAEHAPADVGLPPDAERVLTLCDGEITERHVEGGKTWLVGEVCCHVLYRRGEEYGIGHFSIPFRTFLEGEWNRVCALCTVPGCRISAAREGDGLRADAEVYLSVRCAAERAEQVLCEVKLTPQERSPRADMELCFPASGETLWSVSKRYGISPETLAERNALPFEELGAAEPFAGVHYLVVP